jgi:hypothetical protein
LNPVWFFCGDGDREDDDELGLKRDLTGSLHFGLVPLLLNLTMLVFLSSRRLK